MASFHLLICLCLDPSWWAYLVHLAIQSTFKPSSWHEPFDCVTVLVLCFLHSSADNCRSVNHVEITCDPHSVSLMVPVPVHLVSISFHLWSPFHSTSPQFCTTCDPHSVPLTISIPFHPASHADTEWDVSHSPGKGALHCGGLSRREDAPSEITSTGTSRLFGRTCLQE